MYIFTIVDKHYSTMKKWETVIIDDEMNSIETTELVIDNYCNDIIDIKATFSNPKDAIKGIEQLQPDLILLDIEMPYMNGFELLSKLNYSDFHIIFITAYSQYATKAFKFSALDYLLKPIDGEELRQAVLRIKTENKITSKETFLEAESNLRYFKEPSLTKIALNIGEGIEFVLPSEICFFKSDGNYTTIFFENRDNITFIRPLKDLEDVFVDKGFYRIHNSYLINLQKIKRYIKTDGGALVMENNEQVPISRNKKEHFQRLINKV